MRYGTGSSLSIGPNLTAMVKTLVIACVASFFLQQLVGAKMILIFGLTPYLVAVKFFLWQLFTYLFLHGGLWHLLFNMLALWMFGSDLERRWGSRQFLRFYLITGMGAGLLSILVHPFSQNPTIGASGAVYGILMAYGMLFPDRLVYLYFLFPIKVKYFVAFLGAMAFLSAWSAPGGPIAHIAHLGGMIFGFLYLRGWLTLSGLRQTYSRWKIRRMRSRFEVLDRKRPRPPKDDYWIH